MEHLKDIPASFQIDLFTILLFSGILLLLFVAFTLYIYIPEYIRHRKNSHAWSFLVRRHRIKEWERAMMENVSETDRLMPSYWIAIRPRTFEKLRPDMIRYLKDSQDAGDTEADTRLSDLSARLFDV
jgi:hypothetical protein